MSTTAIATLGLLLLMASTAQAQVVVDVLPGSTVRLPQAKQTVVDTIPAPIAAPPLHKTAIVVDTLPSSPIAIRPQSTAFSAIAIAPIRQNSDHVVLVSVEQTDQTAARVVPVNASLQAQASRIPSICPADLPTALNRIVARTRGIRWGIAVQTQGEPGNRANLFLWNPRTPLIPASNNKIFTTAAALQRLGAQFRFRTMVTANTTGPNVATLRLIGQGDPSLKTAHMAVLAQRLSQRGVRQVDLLIGDDTYFRGAAINPNWVADDTLAGYGAPVNSLMINQNSIGVTLFPQQVGQRLRVQWDDPSDAQDYRFNNRSLTVSANADEFVDVYRDRNSRVINIDGQLRVGSASESDAAAINNPGNYMVQKFRNALTAAQITVNQSTLVRSIPAPPGEVELAFLESPPLATLLKETNQESDNTYAEVWLKTVGKAQSPNNTDATAAGIAAVKSILTPLGVDATQYNMVDGSGLAANNRATPEAFVQTLQAMAASPDAQVFQDSLPVAGVSGTLKSRFRGTIAQGRVQAKTGTISGVATLSGYATPPNYTPLVFSILANSSNASSATMRNAIDEMVLVLMQLRRC